MIFIFFHRRLRKFAFLWYSRILEFFSFSVSLPNLLNSAWGPVLIQLLLKLGLMGTIYMFFLHSRRTCVASPLGHFL